MISQATLESLDELAEAVNKKASDLEIWLKYKKAVENHEKDKEEVWKQV